MNSHIEPAWRAKSSVLRTKYSVLSATLAIVGCLLISRAPADEPPPSDPVQSAQDALAKGGRYPWYDSRQDDVRRLNVQPRTTAEDRGDKWADDGTPQKKTSRRPRFRLLGGFLQWFGLTALVLLLGLIAFLIAKTFLKEETSEDAIAVRKIVESRRDADRVEALPFHVRAANGDFLAEARRLCEAGQYSDAIIYLFSYELVQLDKHHIIRLAKGKTNRQYIRETRQRPHLAAVLEITMIAFEDAFFGRKTLSREAFERSWQRLDEFQGELAREEAAAA